MSTRAHAGLVVGDTEQARKTSAYLQRRLVVFYAVSLALAAALYVVATYVMAVLAPFQLGWSLELFFQPQRLVHLGAILGTAGILYTLRRCEYPASTLAILDAVGLYIAVATCVASYALFYYFAPTVAPAILGLFIVARAIAVPCSAWTTFFLSAPAPIVMLVVQLSFGTAYVDVIEVTDQTPEAAYDRVFEFGRGGRTVRMGSIEAQDFGTRVIWNQVVVWAAVLIAAAASRINFGLRRRALEAEQLGQYRLEEKIGAGSMGEVYRASHAMLRRPTAIKLIQPDGTDPETLKRFRHEVRETSRLTHPNTISIYDYGETPDGVFYYAMEYLDGMDLGEIVEQSGPMTPARVIHVLQQACGALKEAHDAGLVHRDIKPGNIMLCCVGGEHDVVRVVDFGLVKDVRSTSPSLTQVGFVCGTPETMAPEVLRGEDVTPAADLYALGVVGYFLLTRVSVFDAKSANDYIGHHLHTEPPPLRERDASVPADLEAVLMRCLRKEPGERYASAGKLRAELLLCADAGWNEEQAAAAWVGA